LGTELVLEASGMVGEIYACAAYLKARISEKEMSDLAFFCLGNFELSLSL